MITHIQMKTLYSLLFCATLSLTVVAQTPLTQAVDFTVTFTNGEEFNLFEELYSGSYVCVDFFYTTCGPCQSNQGYYSDAFMNFGCNQADIFFLSIESTVGDAATIAYEETYGGPNHPPAASGTEGGGIAVTSAYSVGAFPTFILIAPDGTILEQDMWPLNGTTDTFTTYFGNHGLNLTPCITDVEDVEIALDSDVTLFPNPCNDKINVDLVGFEGQIDLIVYNLLGEIVTSLSTESNSVRIILDEIPTGTYIIHVLDSTRSTQRKFSVVH
jgi:hypothetical protein